MSEYTPTLGEAEGRYSAGRLLLDGARDSGTASERYDEFYRMIAAIEREATARARGEALVELVQAHRNLHETYGNTSACRGGIGGQALTAHCAEVCYNADAHEKEMEAWHKLEVEAIEFSRARAAEYRKAVQ